MLLASVATTETRPYRVATTYRAFFIRWRTRLRKTMYVTARRISTDNTNPDLVVNPQGLWDSLRFPYVFGYYLVTHLGNFHLALHLFHFPLPNPCVTSVDVEHPGGSHMAAG
jgi:hypothetical protein